MPVKKPAPDRKSCASCDSYNPVNPGDEAGYCHLMPPQWMEVDGTGAWARPVVSPADSCRFYLRRLNS